MPPDPVLWIPSSLPELEAAEDSLHRLAGRLPARRAEHAPDGLAAVRLGPSGPLLARLSWWGPGRVPLAGRRPGVIGHFAAADAEAARPALDAACRALAARGCDLALGPMDGNTWRAYRFATEGDDPPFLLEPAQPAFYPRAWEQAGFAPFAGYHSTLDPDPVPDDPRMPGLARRLAAQGVATRPIRLEAFEEDLRLLHDLSLEAFARNLLYTPIPLAEFLAMYQDARPWVDPALVRVAVHQGRCVGFVFAVPDRLEAGRGLPVRTLVVKTLAVRTGRAWAGLGALLLREVRLAAAARGCTRVIHALMHDANVSRNMAGPRARVLRRYTILARELAPASGGEITCPPVSAPAPSPA